MKNKAIILLGIKHSGKSTQGELLANRTGCPFVDIDTVITEMTGKTPRELYNENGPAGFMEAEENACIQTAQKYKNTAVVIATGGGICENAPALDFVRRLLVEPALEELRQLGEFVFINVEENIAAGRILKKAEQNEDGTWKNLPAYIAKENPKTEAEIRKLFHTFYEKRTETYKQIADITIDTKDKTKQENARFIAETLGF